MTRCHSINNFKKLLSISNIYILFKVINRISENSQWASVQLYGNLSRRLFQGIWLGIALLISTVTVAQEAEIDRVLAIVDSDVITLNDYRSRHRQERFENPQLPPFDGQVDPQVLERLVDELIQTTQAERRGLSVSSREVDEAVQFVASQNDLSVEQLVEQLESRGFTYADFRENMRKQQLIRKLIDAVANSRVVVSDQEIENYMKSHEELQTFDESYELSHLFVLTTEKSAEEAEADKENLEFIRTSILDGQDFAQAARSYSDASENEDGGYLGWRSSDQLPELFLDALRDMSPDNNPVSSVLQSENGLHLLKLHARRGSGNMVEQQEIQHILLQPNEINTPEETLNLANELYQQIQEGESFEKLARLYSDDAQSRTRGGLLGWVNPGELAPPFEEAARRLQLNVVSEPVQTRYGFHLIKVLQRRQSDMSTELAVNQARQAIFQRKAAELYGTWLENVRQRTYIEYVGV